LSLAQGEKRGGGGVTGKGGGKKGGKRKIKKTERVFKSGFVGVKRGRERGGGGFERDR